MKTARLNSLTERNLLSEEHVARTVWSLALPTMIASIVQSANSFLDRIFVGRLGAEALAAVGVGGQMVFLTMALAMAVSTGATAIVARMVGANDRAQLREAARQALGIAIVLGVLLTVLGYLLLPFLLDWYRLNERANRLAHEFLGWALLGVPGTFLLMGLSGTFRGLGDTRSPMIASIGATLAHILGDWLLIFGNLGFPNLGIQGAGIAMALSTWVGAGILWVQQWVRSERELAIPAFPIRAWWVRIMRIGLPASARTFIYSTSSVMFTGILSATAAGTAAVAALPIGLTAESIAFMPGFAFAIAASALVGQALGAKNERLAERFGWASAWQACAVMTTMAIVFFVFAEYFARLFTSDPKVIELAVAYLRINALTEPLLAFGMVLAGALQGAGDSLKAMLATFITQWVVRIPLAYLMAFWLGWDAYGAWGAMALSSGFSGLLMMYLFKRGGWKKVRV
ncbi:putative efflux protein, MATE family [Armatimonadetes bacterium DC]|nr:putative efflux protein, MATE family [Armatimonadetes bacterium DC]